MHRSLSLDGLGLPGQIVVRAGPERVRRSGFEDDEILAVAAESWHGRVVVVVHGACDKTVLKSTRAEV